MKVSDYIASALKENGIDTVFGFQGSNVTHIIDSVSKTEGVRYIQNHHEQASSFAACAYSSVTNNLGCAVSSSGPGAINMISGIANAWFDSIPVVFITGQLNTKSLRASSDIRQQGFQEFDIVTAVKEFTKYATTVKDPNEICYHLEKAIYLAKSGRKGGVLLDIPHNVQTSQIEISSCNGYSPEDSTSYSVDEKDIRSSLELIKNSKRPLVLVGGGAKELRNSDIFQEVLKRFDLPVVASLNGLDVLSHTSEYFFGFIGSYGNRYANMAISECDLLLVLGSRLDVHQIGNYPEEFAKNAKIIHVDIDRNELSHNILPDISVNTDCISFLEYLVSVCEEFKKLNSEWFARLNSLKNSYPVFTREDPKTLPNEILYSLSKEFSCSDIVTGDVGQNQMWTAQSVFLKDNMRLLNSAGLGSMGFSLAASIGACYANPGCRVLCISGDGGILMNIQELGTISREKLPVKIIIMNNRSLGLIRTYQNIVFKNDVGSVTGFSSPDYEVLAKSYDISYAMIEEPADIEKIHELLSNPFPLLVEVKLAPDTEVHPEPAYLKPVHIQSPLLICEEK